MKITHKKTNRVFQLFVAAICTWLMIFSLVILTHAASLASGSTIVTGLKVSEVSISDGSYGSWTQNDSGLVVCSVKTKAGECGGSNKATTGTLVLTNDTYSEAELKFSYTIDSGATLKIGNDSFTSSGTYEGAFNNGETLSISFTSNAKNTGSNYTLTLSDFSLTEKKTISVTFLPDPKGQFAYTVSGNAVPVNSTGISISVDTGSGVSFSIDENTSIINSDKYVLAGWEWKTYDSTNTLTGKGLYSAGNAAIRTGDSGTLKLSESCTVSPIFVFSTNNEAPFSVSNMGWWTWETAFTAANSSTKTVTLNDSYVLPGVGDTDILTRNGLTADGTYVDFTMDSKGTVTDVIYKVPSGFTFHIPYDSSFTGLKNSIYPQVLTLTDVNPADSDFPSHYSRGTLTASKGTTIASNGTFIINGSQMGATWRFTGSACGPHGLLKLTDSTSKLHIQSGTLYCYGYVTGSGIVESNNNAVIYELLQLRDWRGFTASASWLGVNVDTSSYTDILAKVGDLRGLASDPVSAQKNHRSFIFSQYYVQNIESTLKLNVGATLNTVLTMNTKEDTPQEIVPFVTGLDGGGFLKLSGSGALYRNYNSSDDRITYTMDCDATTGSIKLTFGINMKDVISVDIDLDTIYNILALNHNMTIKVKTNHTLTVASDLKMLPESIVEVEQGGNLVIDSAEFFLYDKLDWTDGNYSYNYDMHQLHYSATRAGAPVSRGIDESAKLIIDGTMAIKSGANVFTTAGYVRNGASAVADRKTEDKVITSTKGTGKIINESAIGDKTGELDEFEFGSNNWTVAHQITTIPFVSKFKGGDIPYNSFATATYYSLPNNFWYNWKVSAVDENGNSADNLVTLTSTAAADSTAGDKIVGYVSNYWNGTANAQSAFTFKVADGYNVSIGENELPPDENGVITLPTISADTTLVLTCNHTGGSANCTTGAICTNCGTEYTDSSPDAHEYQSTVTDPTCTAAGYTTYVCNYCGDTYTSNQTAALGHTSVTDAAVAATCTSTGLTEGSHCSVCNEILVAQTVVPKLDHTSEVIPAVAPTCTATGLSEGAKCSVCGEILTQQTSVPALGHTPVTDAAVDATCDASGKTEGSHCSVCSTILVAQETIPALGHTEVTLPAVAPTCVKSGLTEGKKCSACDEVTVAQEVVPATGEHTPEVVPAVDPTCTVDGKTEGSKCSVCGTTLTAQDPISAQGHAPVVDPKVDPTCTKTGLTEGSHCDVCGEIIVAQEEIPALGHKWENGTCSVCGEVCSHPDEDGDGTCDICECDHAYVAADTPANCTMAGYTTYTCSACGHSYSVIHEEEQPALGHTPGKGPTCTEPQKCTVCGTELAPAAGHTYNAAVTAPTCTEVGFTTYTCSKCDDTYTADEIEALGHTAGSTVIENKTGYVCTGFTYDKVIYCTVCTGEISRIKETQKASDNHSYESVVTSPTCTEQGYTTHTCNVCKDEITDTYTAASGHSHGDWEITTKATITSPAVETRKCHCGDTQTQSIKESASVKNPDSEEVKNYLTLSEALGAAAEGATVTLLTDIDGTVSINQVVTIELGSYSATITAAKGYTYAEQNDGKTVVIGKATLSIGATNIKAGDSLDLFFYVKIASLGDSTDYKAVVTRIKGEASESRTDTVTEIPYSKWTKYNSTYMRFCYDGIAAKEMGDPVTVVICKGDGTPLSGAYTQSIQGYAMNMLGKASSTVLLKTALVDMLNYGAAAQTHFGYMASELANSKLTAEQAALGTQEDPTCTKLQKDNLNFVQASVSVKNYLTYSFFFKDIDPAKATAMASYVDHYGNTKSQTITEFSSKQVAASTDSAELITVYGVDVKDIAIADGRSEITCTVTQTDASGNPTVVASAVSSIEDYLAAASAQLNDPVYMMLMKFVDSAKAYFASL